VNIDGSQKEGSNKEKSNKEDRKEEEISSLTQTYLISFGWGRNSPALLLRSYYYETRSCKKIQANILNLLKNKYNFRCFLLLSGNTICPSGMSFSPGKGT
jgi:hypothetical protein